MNNLNLYIIRGTSGSGKSTFAQSLIDNLSCKAHHFEADNWMTDDQGNYKFDASKLNFCHNRCQYHTEQSMLFEVPVVIVSNTGTRNSEIEPYILLAKKYGYNYTCLVVENRNNTKSVHNVPEMTLAAQEERLIQSLKLR